MQIFKKIFNLPFIQAIQEAGGEVFAVGGCVRDYHMGKKPKDIDLIVRLLPHGDLQEILLRYGQVDLVGESFGVFKFKSESQEFDIALPRRDIKIKGAKGHKSIEAQSDHLMSLNTDLERRDFRFNAMAFDKDNVLIDPFNGMDDIQQAVVSCVSTEAFVEDPLRMIRAVQFAARFDFIIDPDTCQLILQHKHLIKEITTERVLDEFRKVFDKGGRGLVFAEYLRVLGLWEELFGVEILNRNYDLHKSLSEFLHLSISTSHRPAEFFKEKLKIDNGVYKDLQALQLMSDNLHNKEYNIVNAFHGVFASLKKSDIVLRSPMVDPAYTEPFKTGRFPKKMSELALSGEEFMELGLQGKEIGKAQEQLLDMIFRNEILNDREQLVSKIKAMQL